jgi:hypothetical protein
MAIASLLLGTALKEGWLGGAGGSAMTTTGVFDRLKVDPPLESTNRMVSSAVPDISLDRAGSTLPVVRKSMCFPNANRLVVKSSPSLGCFSEMQEATHCLDTAFSLGFVGIGPAARRCRLRGRHPLSRVTDDDLFGLAFLHDDRFPMFCGGRRLRCRCQRRRGLCCPDWTSEDRRRRRVRHRDDGRRRRGGLSSGCR